MASVTGAGSTLAFFGHGQSGANVNIDLTTNGAGAQPQSEPGKLNIEVFTTTPGPVAPGYQASAFIPGATLVGGNVVSNAGQTNVTEQLLSGSFKVVDETGNEAIQIVGSAAGGDSITVVGSSGDTISGSTIAGTQQLIDASGKNHRSIAGPETIFGGAGPTTILAGAGDSIIGGSGDLVVIGGSNDTIVGGSGSVTIRGGKDDSVTAGSGGIVSVKGHRGRGNGGADDDTTVAGADGKPSDDSGKGASTVTGFSSAPDATQPATSDNSGRDVVGTSHSTASGTVMNFDDGSSMLIAGVSDPGKLDFMK